jgi:cytosine permease
MSTQVTETPSQLPSYITSATPNPLSNRAPWYKNTAPTYAGIFLWFVFWQAAVSSGTAGGGLAAGLGVALLGLALAALICHFLFYLVPGMLGMKTGLPLYIVGTSTYGATGGFLMPGFLMGLLQFGWLGVNTYFSSMAISAILPPDQQAIGAKAIMVVWGVLAAFVGLKGIKYVAPVATYLPLVPLAILLVMTVKTIGGLGSFDPQKLVAADTAAPVATPLNAFGVIALMLSYVVGFFATAGAAGVDFGMNNRDEKDVQMGGLVGIALAIMITAGLSAVIVAGAHGIPELSAKAVAAGRPELNSTNLIPIVLGSELGKWLLFALALTAFPSACFSSFIAANSFKTTLSNVNPFVSVGIGAAVSIALALSGWAGQAATVFSIIGASFGPICGAMAADYLLNGKQWSGPRAGFNPAGWISWVVGFVVGLMGVLPGIGVKLPFEVPAAPVAAFIVGFVVYILCAKIGLLSPVVPIPQKTVETV